jgi:hypothetical protein
MESFEHSISTSQPKKITKRKIIHGNINQTSVNKNCPKFILGHCLINFKTRLLEECHPDNRDSVLKSFEIIKGWLAEGQRDKLTIKHLKELFGDNPEQEEKQRRYSFSKIYFRFIARTLLENIMMNKKV